MKFAAIFVCSSEEIKDTFKRNCSLICHLSKVHCVFFSSLWPLPTKVLKDGTQIAIIHIGNPEILESGGWYNLRIS